MFFFNKLLLFVWITLPKLHFDRNGRLDIEGGGLFKWVLFETTSWKLEDPIIQKVTNRI